MAGTYLTDPSCGPGCETMQRNPGGAGLEAAAAAAVEMEALEAMGAAEAAEARHRCTAHPLHSTGQPAHGPAANLLIVQRPDAP